MDSVQSLSDLQQFKLFFKLEIGKLLLNYIWIVKIQEQVHLKRYFYSQIARVTLRL